MKLAAQYLCSLLLGFVALLTLSCHKSGGPGISPVSFNIVNAIPSSNPLIPVFGTTDTIQYFADAVNIGYGGSAEYSPLGGQNTLYIAQYGDTTALDLKQALFRGSFDLKSGKIYSLFLSGDTTGVDTLFVADEIPTYTDSSAGVRFVNLSPGSPPISVNIQGNLPSQTEFADLQYKGVSVFKQYVASSSAGGGYTFEIRDQSTGNLLYTFFWSFTLFRCNTLVISGSEDPNSNFPLQVFQVNNY